MARLSPRTFGVSEIKPPLVSEREVPTPSTEETTPKQLLSWDTLESATTGRDSSMVIALEPVLRPSFMLTYLFLSAETMRPGSIGPSGNTSVLPGEVCDTATSLNFTLDV
jgi:hypothetical protein